MKHLAFTCCKCSKELQYPEDTVKKLKLRDLDSWYDPDKGYVNYYFCMNCADKMASHISKFFVAGDSAGVAGVVISNNSSFKKMERTYPCNYEWREVI